LKVPFWNTRGKHNIYWKGPYSKKETIFAQELSSTSFDITVLQLLKIEQVLEFEVMDNPNIRIHKIDYDEFVKETKNEIYRLVN